MDPHHFDALSRALTEPGTRRRLLGGLATLPFLGGITTLLPEGDLAAKERRRRRKQRHKRRKNPGSRKGKHKSKGKGTKRCTPEAASQTCSGRCGKVTNNCQQVVECEPCCTTPTAALLPTDDLQTAIDTACDGVTLTLDPGTWMVPDTLVIAKPLTLIGAGAGQTTLSGGDQRRVLAITANVLVTLQALTITQGKDSFGGGGIHSVGKLTLIDAELTANTSTENLGGGGGGAIWSGNDLTLRNTVVRLNESAAFGGGILVDNGTLLLEAGSRIEENTATTDGGGIYNFGTVDLQDGSQLRNNHAARSGGALYNDGGTAKIEAGALICGNTTTPQCAGVGTVTPSDACPSTLTGACPS
jgi:hypothetical protein